MIFNASRRAAMVCGAVFAGSLTWSAAWAGQPLALRHYAIADAPSRALATRSGRPAVRPVARSRIDAPLRGTPNFNKFAADFQDQCTPPVVAPYALPLGFTLWNVDARTPANEVNYVTNAWVVRDDIIGEADSCVMVSTSWYTPFGAADDWAVFPAAASVGIPVTAATRLRWRAVAVDEDYPDGYQVRVSTGGANVADFQATPLLDVANENSDWTTHTIDLSAFAGQTVRLAFRNDSNDQFVLQIDDILVREFQPFDPELLGTSPVGEVDEYSLVPAQILSPGGISGMIDAQIDNLGLQPLTGVTVTADVFFDGSLQATTQSTPQPLAVNASATATTAPFTVTPGVGTWTYEATVTSTEGDDDPGNSTRTGTLLELTEDEYRRAEGEVTGSLGIGANNGGELGHHFDIDANATMTGVKFAIVNFDEDGDNVGDFNDRQIEVVVRDWDQVADEPGDVVGTGFIDVPGDAAVNDVLEFTAPVGSLDLVPGRYFVGVLEPLNLATDAALGLATHASRFTPAAGWIIWPTSGGWVHPEDFGLPVTFGISAMFGSATTTQPAADNDAFSVGEDTQLADSVAGNDLPSTDTPNAWTVTDDVDSGTLVLNAANGSFTYQPDADFAGSDSFTYQLCSSAPAPSCDTATASITVTAVDDPVTAVDDAYTAPPATQISGNVSSNDLVPDGGGVWSVINAPVSGTFAFNADGSFTYTPAADQSGPIAFNYQVCDADNDCDDAIASIEVLPERIFADGFED